MVQAVVTFFTGFFKSLLSKRDYHLGWNIQLPDGTIYSISYFAYIVLDWYEKHYRNGFYIEVEPMPNNRIFSLSWYNFAFFVLLLDYFKNLGFDPETTFDDLAVRAGGVGQVYQDWIKTNVYDQIGVYIAFCIQTVMPLGPTDYIVPMVDNFFIDETGIVPDDAIEESTELEGSVHTWYARITPIMWAGISLALLLIYKILKR
jgi:hypothetical protein